MFEFTDADLKANKGGQLSPGQKQWLKGIARGTRRFSWIHAGIAVGFTGLGLCIVLALSLQNERARAALLSSPVNLIVLVGIVPLILGILALMIFLNYRGAGRLENSVLSSASGEVRLDRDSSGESSLISHYVFVGRKRFTFGEDQSETFREGASYRIYYCRAGGHELVMSYERIDR